ncbi:hypothetical protein C0995_002385 [Termitomyces sp. Mi166|nr:hypothetical protein C0995_002385 [Termitomyces sp. Mi166\
MAHPQSPTSSSPAPGKPLPADPILLAKVRFFIDTVTNTTGSSFGVVAMCRESTQRILNAVEKIESLLPAEGYAVREEFTIADIAVTPFFASWVKENFEGMGEVSEYPASQPM